MNTQLLIHNLVAYSLQLACVVAVGALAARLVRVKAPWVRLACWHFLLAVSIVAPLVGPWRPMGSGSAAVRAPAIAVEVDAAPLERPLRLPWREALLVVLAGGVLFRLGWLGLGMWRLRRYRLAAEPLRSDVLKFQTAVAVGVSDEIGGPVTFGVVRPLILLPRRFTELKVSEQEAVLCHELVHVERHDWAFTLAEELLRAALWFHPAIWWLLAQIQLAREQAVDHAAVQLTQDRRAYLDALVSVAGAQPEVELVAAPSFLRKHHLSRRVASLLEEVTMSKRKMAAAVAALCGLTLAAGMVAVRAFPLLAAGQSDVPKAEVRSAGPKLLHSVAPEYPAEALLKGVQGQVVVQVKINQKGLVEDAQVLSGPAELRKAALRSVLDWHYAADPSFPTETQVAVDFSIPAGFKPAQPRSAAGGPPGAAPASRPVKLVDYSALPENVRNELSSRVSLRTGDMLTLESIMQLKVAAAEVDEHIIVNLLPAGDGTVVRMAMREADPRSMPFAAQVSGEPPQHPSTPGVPQIRVGGMVQASKIVSRPRPEYPALAKQARIQGTVRLDVLIDREGAVKDLVLVAGHPLLAQAAIDAVKQWKWANTLLNGNPVEVITTVDVNFTLSE